MKKILILIIAAGLADNFADTPGPHSCRWELCPYKGITVGNYEAAVKDYTGSPEGSDGYCIDLLHLQHPDKDYEQLEDLLFSQFTHQ